MRNRLILVDDNPAFLRTVTDILTPEFEIVGTASDGETLLRIVSELNPDLVVLDITMPGINGLEAARRLNSLGARAKIVLLTVHDDPDYVLEARGAGVSGYVTKCNLAFELPHVIRRVLAGAAFIAPRSTKDSLRGSMGADAK